MVGEGCPRNTIFSIVVHLRTWITEPIAVDAPLNYFTVMGKLMVYDFYFLTVRYPNIHALGLSCSLITNILNSKILYLIHFGI